MLVEKRFDTGEVELNYVEGPDNGPPLLFLHEFTGRWQTYIPIINQFINRWHVYALDFRGHGASGQTRDKYGLRYHYNDTIRFISQVIKRPVNIIGHALGGRVALTLASNNPYITKTIVCGDISLTFNLESETLENVYRFMADTLEKTNSVEELMEVYRDRLGVDNEALMTLCKNYSMLDPNQLRFIADHMTDLDDPESYVFDYRPLELMKRVSCPLLLLQAEHGVMKDVDVEKALRVLSSGYHVKLLGFHHLLLNKEIASVVRAMNSFLEAFR